MSDNSSNVMTVLDDGNETECHPTDDSNGEWDFSLRFEFAVHGVLLCSVGTLGLLGNLFSVVILSRPQMKSSINTLLIGLVSCDSLLIATSICLFSFTNFRHTGSALFTWYYWHVYPYILPFVYPVGLIAQTGSAYMTLGVTIERYFVVCWPLKSRSICTQGRAKMAVGSFLCFAALYNIPRFLEVTWATAFIPELCENRTVFVVRALRTDPLYISVYVTWTYLVFMYIVPFTSLAVLNLLIFLEIRKANATRARLSNQEKKEHSLAVMLLVVVLIFFICNISALIINIIEFFLEDVTKNQQFIQLSNLLVTINSSVNFLVYCIFGNKFKQMFMQIFCGRKPRLQAVHRAAGLELRRSQMDTMSYNRRLTRGNVAIGGGGGGIDAEVSSFSNASSFAARNHVVNNSSNSRSNGNGSATDITRINSGHEYHARMQQQQQQQQRKDRVNSAMRSISVNSTANGVASVPPSGGSSGPTAPANNSSGNSSNNNISVVALINSRTTEEKALEEVDRLLEGLVEEEEKDRMVVRQHNHNNSNNSGSSSQQQQLIITPQQRRRRWNEREGLI